MVVGGNGRTVNDDEPQFSFFLQLELCFFGIPGECSQENGTPENRKGVVAGESSRSGTLHDDTKDDEKENGAVHLCCREDEDGCSFIAGNTVFLLGVADDDSILQLVLFFLLLLLCSYCFNFFIFCDPLSLSL